jgi:glycine C-acetyltransferase
VNGGYVVADETTISYLRETTPSYIYSNPISPAEAAAAIESVRVIDSEEGRQRLANLRRLGQKRRQGLSDMGHETIMGDHPIVPILVRDTERTSAMVAHSFESDILVTGLNYPVVPKGDEEIRLQVSASHTEADIDYLLDSLKRFGRVGGGCCVVGERWLVPLAGTVVARLDVESTRPPFF